MAQTLSESQLRELYPELLKEDVKSEGTLSPEKHVLPKVSPVSSARVEASPSEESPLESQQPFFSAPREKRTVANNIPDGRGTPRRTQKTPTKKGADVSRSSQKQQAKERVSKAEKETSQAKEETRLAREELQRVKPAIKVREEVVPTPPKETKNAPELKARNITIRLDPKFAQNLSLLCGAYELTTTAMLKVVVAQCLQRDVASGYIKLEQE